jgi:hypothetical protein
MSNRDWDLVEGGLAVAAFAVLCVVILRTATFLPEPDDYAYRASIVALSQGHALTLSGTQGRALAAQLGGHFGFLGTPIAQWVRLPGGRFISEKDPGYPFLAVPFQAAGIIRWAPLSYGALACLGLFAGARRWLGRFGGAAAVGLYCSCGAALLWGWRDYMPTFTDASLIAAGTGALLWAMLAAEASPRRRAAAGLAGFVAIEAAVFTRYTDVVVLAIAIIAVVAARRAARLPRAALGWWLGSAVVFGGGVAAFDDRVYGGPLRSGYRPGEITFSLSAIGPNLRYLPPHLMQAMPALVLGLAALAWISGRRAWPRRAGPAASARTGSSAGPGIRSGTGALAGAARRDFAVAAALAGSWAAVWGLYAAYTWTARPFGSTLQMARFYVPALGAIALLGAWLVTRVPRRAAQPSVTAVACAVAVAAMFSLGIASFHDMIAAPPIGTQIARPAPSARPAPQDAPGTS